MVMSTATMNSKEVIGENSPNIVSLLSDLEEGELEEISDVSSEEEMLLRQRIEILENYSSALERKYQREKSVCKDGGNISRKEKRRFPRGKHFKSKRRRKCHRHRALSSSDTENDSIIINKKQILREAIGIGDKKVICTSLKNRLFPELNKINLEEKQDDLSTNCRVDQSKDDLTQSQSVEEKSVIDVLLEQQSVEGEVSSQCKNRSPSVSDDDDAEVLRQLALKSKSERKQKAFSPVDGNVREKVAEKKEDDGSDYDVTELRMIALKSAMLKKANERKRRRIESKRRNSKLFRISKTLSDIEDGLTSEENNSQNNNTDIEEVDMCLDNDGMESNTNTIFYDQAYDSPLNFPYMNQEYNCNYPVDNGQGYQYMYNDLQYYDSNNYVLQPFKQSDACVVNPTTPDTGEDDADMLRAQLLISLNSNNSKSAPNIPEASPHPVLPKPSNTNFIICLGESDNESDCEETKRLIKTNQEILKETLFQRNLDMFLKSARSKVESIAPSTPKQSIDPALPAKKFTPMAVKHLPAADQQEYRDLVKRMNQLQNNKMLKQQQAMINNIASKSYDDDSAVSAITETIQTLDTPGQVKASNSNADHTAVLANSQSNEKPDASSQVMVKKCNVYDQSNVKSTVPRQSKESSMDNKPVEPTRDLRSNKEIIEERIKLTKTIELHLVSTRKKIFNYKKLSKRLEGEAKNYELKYENLKLQAQEIEIAMRNTREKILNNKRLATTTNKALVKLQKHEEILSDKIKTVTKNYNKLLHENSSSTSNSYSTKITMKNKVINKKANTNKNVTVPQSSKVNKQTPSNFANSKKVQINKDVKSLNSKRLSVSKVKAEVQQLKIKSKENKQCIALIDSVESKCNPIVNMNECDNKQQNNLHNDTPECGTLSDVVNKAVIKDPIDDAKANEYISPLHVLNTKSLLVDNTQDIFCPFEVGGNCKDPQCKYFHARPS